MAKIKTYAVIPGIGCNPCIERNLKDVFVWLEESEVGDEIKITVGEMDEVEYLNLPEYMGP